MEIPFNADGDCVPVRRSALVIGHPGHELKVFGWMVAQKPLVSVLTDGSGRSGVSRLPSSQRLLRSVGATEGLILGFFSDAEFYTAVLERRIGCFTEIADLLARSFMEHEIGLVAGDAAEGYNPAHDLCRAIIDAAVTIVQGCTARIVKNYAFVLAEERGELPQAISGESLNLRLNDHVFQEKLAASERYEEMRYEVQTGIAKNGKEFFRNECLIPVTEPFALWPPGYKPYYEIFGEQRMSAGAYTQVIRYREHVLPVVEALRDHAIAFEKTNPMLVGRRPSSRM